MLRSNEKPYCCSYVTIQHCPGSIRVPSNRFYFALWRKGYDDKAQLNECRSDGGGGVCENGKRKKIFRAALNGKDVAYFYNMLPDGRRRQGCSRKKKVVI